jgi:hypothetical protein
VEAIVNVPQVLMEEVMEGQQEEEEVVDTAVEVVHTVEVDMVSLVELRLFA